MTSTNKPTYRSTNTSYPQQKHWHKRDTQTGDLAEVGSEGENATTTQGSMHSACTLIPSYYAKTLMNNEHESFYFLTATAARIICRLKFPQRYGFAQICFRIGRQTSPVTCQKRLRSSFEVINNLREWQTTLRDWSCRRDMGLNRFVCELAGGRA